MHIPVPEGFAVLSSASLGLDIIHQRNLKFYLAMYVACAETKDAYVSPGKILTIDVPGITEASVKDCFDRVWKKYEIAEVDTDADASDYDQLAKGPNLLKVLNTELRRRFTKRKPRKAAGATT